MVKDLLKNEMNLRFQSSDESILWYSFKNLAGQQPVSLNADDLREFPIVFLQHARLKFDEGNMEKAEELYDMATQAPILSKGHKAFAYSQLASIYLRRGDTKEAESVLLLAAKTAPHDPVCHLNLAFFYDIVGENDKIDGLIKRALALGGRKKLEGDPIYSKLKRYIDK